MLLDIASIVFVCVTMNHLGLIKAIESTTEQELPILNCPKCSSFWWSLVYCLFITRSLIPSLAISFFASYSAIWLELLEGYLDKFYIKFYDKIYSATDTADDGA